MGNRSRFALATGLLGIAALMTATRYGASDRNARALWSDLGRGGVGEPFRPELVEGVPEPARRFLLRAIAPGTPLARTAELHMRGELLLDPERPALSMRAEQVLAPPDGFVWRARASGGPLRIEGFDLYGRGRGELRWKLYGLIPVVRGSGSDVTRSAAGRLAMESVMMPAALVPGRGAAWEAVDDRRARFRMTVGDETVVTTLEVDDEGRPIRASAQRWTADARPDGPGYETFAVDLAGDLVSGGYTIPQRVSAGWRLGQPDEFRFFNATLISARFR